MRRTVTLLLCLSLLALPARAVPETGAVAVCFADGPSAKVTHILLRGLALRGVHATFLLRGSRAQSFPETTRRIAEEGHELGCRGYSSESMAGFSRRRIAAQLLSTQAQLPQNCRAALFCPPGDAYTDGIRQVARARGMAVVGWTLDASSWETLTRRELLERVRDGDILLLREERLEDVLRALAVVDLLQEAGFRVMGISELAAAQRVRLKPGQRYDRFPPARPQTLPAAVRNGQLTTEN